MLKYGISVVELMCVFLSIILLYLFYLNMYFFRNKYVNENYFLKLL